MSGPTIYCIQSISSFLFISFAKEVFCEFVLICLSVDQQEETTCLIVIKLGVASAKEEPVTFLS